ncbi:MAG TPA: hypothetical protein VGX68_18880 [Thermoanaerobaculia bacterium]|jgi:hypothetical protein|nr:hypothetical protein [Thermoanaerobaculia bacterium]
MDAFTAGINVLTALAAAAAAVVTFIGLNSWRRQLRTNADFEAARRALLAALKVRDSIISFRNPMHWVQEIAASGAKDLNYERDLYTKRWEQVTAAGEELRLVELEGEVLWGREYLDRLRPLTDCIRDLGWGIQDYLRRKEEAPGTDPKSPWLAEAEAVVKSKSKRDAPDTYEKRLLDAVTGLEEFLRPKLAAKR